MGLKSVCECCGLERVKKKEEEREILITGISGALKIEAHHNLFSILCLFK